VNWQRIGESRGGDVATCLSELLPAMAALSGWGMQVANSEKRPIKGGELLLGLLLPTAMSGGLMADALNLGKGNSAIKIDTTWLQICGPSPFPNLSSKEAEQFFNSPISSAGRERCFAEIVEAYRLLQPNVRLTARVDAGRVYYVEWNPTKMELMNAEAATKWVPGLLPWDLVNAASEGDPSRVKAFLNAESDSGSKQVDALTAFMSASANGKPEVVRELLDDNVDVNAKQADGMTALMLASSEGHLEVVRELLDAKADVNASDPSGTTALMFASSEGRLEVVQALLDAKADLNAKDSFRLTALMLATRNRHPEVAHLLKSAAAARR
jgi:hypothetical protein